MMRSVRWGAALSIVAWAVAGCQGGGGGGSTASRDSAGIAIVENTGPSWSDGQGWKVVDSVLIDIGGGKAGGSSEELDRVSGPVRLSDGRLAIANAGTNEVRIFDASGQRLHSSGRAGSGPGEFQNIGGIWAGPGDSLLVFDVLVRRLTVLDHDGGFGRILTLGGGAGLAIPVNGKFDFAVPLGWFADGSIVGVSQTFTLNQARPGIYRDSVTMIRYGPDGVVRDTLGRFPGAEMEQMTLTFNGQSIATPSPVPLGRQSVTLVHGDRFYLAQNNRWEIEVRSLGGSLKRLVRAEVAAAPLTPGDAAANRKELLEQMDAQPMLKNLPAAFKDQLRSRIEQAKYPATRPFFGLLLADEQGNLWAQEVAAPGDKTQRYAVVDSTGRFLGRVTLPTGFRLSAIGAGMLYGVWKDEDDLEHVRGYRLSRTP